MRASHTSYKYTAIATSSKSPFDYNMSDTATHSAAKKTKAPRKPKVPAAHPPFAKMIVDAIKDLKEKNGSSRQAILKHIKAHNKIDEKVAEVHLRRALVSATAAGKLIRTKGAGASGSFKLSEKAKKEPVTKTHVKKTAKPKATKVVESRRAAAPKKTTKPKKVVKAVKPKKASAAKPKKPSVKKTPKKAAKK
ncbi:unnamed protein product [Schistocephalus solidus]|uniref:H15 domain-containing protein n=2 Tax=Schistocephalus solidus TaxID=70667 RepID=A0A183TDV1_SCHSO|nr:unnamed protein product [Schistocephalus solidus]